MKKYFSLITILLYISIQTHSFCQTIRQFYTAAGEDINILTNGNERRNVFHFSATGDTLQSLLILAVTCSVNDDGSSRELFVHAVRIIAIFFETNSIVTHYYVPPCYDSLMPPECITINLLESEIYDVLSKWSYMVDDENIEVRSLKEPIGVDFNCRIMIDKENLKLFKKI